MKTILILSLVLLGSIHAGDFHCAGSAHVCAGLGMSECKARHADCMWAPGKAIPSTTHHCAGNPTECAGLGQAACGPPSCGWVKNQAPAPAPAPSPMAATGHCDGSAHCSGIKSWATCKWDPNCMWVRTAPEPVHACPNFHHLDFQGVCVKDADAPTEAQIQEKIAWLKTLPAAQRDALLAKHPRARREYNHRVLGHAALAQQGCADELWQVCASNNKIIDGWLTSNHDMRGLSGMDGF